VKMLRTIGLAIGAGMFLCVVAFGWFVYALYGDASSPKASTQVVVAQGSTFTQVANQLAEAGVVSSAFLLRALARMEHADAQVHAGAFRFAPHQTPKQVLNALLTGGAQIAAWVTIPEGFTASQIAQRLHENGVGQEDELRSYFLAHHLEGYLFPSTYLVALDATPGQIARELGDEFNKQLPSDAKERAKALGISVAQGVTVASLVEREAKADSDRPLIAGVIYNRLKLAMPLQVDATIEYALPKHKTELSFGDLKIDSPYNSYTHEGLPPTPIANPGHASLEAAFHPARTEALYYVYCGNGHHVFAKTLQEHQANVARCLPN
jgi:UPF0755 protein